MDCRLLLPLITWQVVGNLEPGDNNNSKSLSMYGFLYGTFPTAPSVFLYASQFSVAQDVVSYLRMQPRIAKYSLSVNTCTHAGKHLKHPVLQIGVSS